MRRIDLTGMRFGRLVVNGPSSERRNGHLLWECTCDCGKEHKTYSQQLRNGSIKSCGCLQADIMREKQLIHGMYGTRLYNIYNDMKQRCNNKKHKHYNNYGGRGITICDEWDNFASFSEWAINNEYSDSLELDRKNNDIGYNPENCRFVSRMVQANNKRSVVKHTAFGETHSLSEWSRITGINYYCLKARIKKLNWDIEKALSLNSRGRNAANE